MTSSPRARRRQQQVARWAKRAPGYQLLITEVLPRVRRNALLSDVAWRVFGAKHGAGQVDVPLLPDRHLVGKDARMVPVVGIVGLGLDESGAAALIEEVARLQREHRSFRPLLVLDHPAFASARAHGYVVEHVLPRTSWSDPEIPYLAYLAERLGSLIDHYQLWHLVHVEGTAVNDRDRALLAALAHRLPELEVRLADP